MPEDQNIEYKRSWDDEFLKWICGFANAKGGKIYIGIDDNGNVTGIQNSRKLMEDLPNKVKSLMGILIEVNLHEGNNKHFLALLF
jgi:ATP-dependent DNA helicase RecG